GDRLLAEDSVRTQDDGVMELAVNRTRVRIRERSEFQIKTVTDQVLRARARGHIDGEVPAGQGKLEVRAMEGDAVVGSEGGEFSMTADDKGVVAVAAKGGEVSLTSAGRTVNLKSGQVSRVRPGQGPDAPAAALRRVLLSVAWPARKETNQRRYPIAGKVEAGTRVLVQGRPVAVDPEGNFHVEVPLRDGKQNVAVVAVDVLGRRAAADAAVRFDNKLDARLREQLWGR
ncbi:MAG TPA: hypothetical protein VEY30_01080, partial [Myxococcaceae bacterium]|nr:hypothetical protein [Myxococcaceae bacterium]